MTSSPRLQIWWKKVGGTEVGIAAGPPVVSERHQEGGAHGTCLSPVTCIACVVAPGRATCAGRCRGSVHSSLRDLVFAVSSPGLEGGDGAACFSPLPEYNLGMTFKQHMGKFLTVYTSGSRWIQRRHFGSCSSPTSQEFHGTRLFSKQEWLINSPNSPQGDDPRQRSPLWSRTM